MKDVVVPYYMNVNLYDDKGEKVSVVAKIDSGADNCSIDEKLAKDLGLSDRDDILAEADIANANGVSKRPVIRIEFEVSEYNIETVATVSDRSSLDCPLLIGRSALKHDSVRFLINPLEKAATLLKRVASRISLKS